MAQGWLHWFSPSVQSVSSVQPTGSIFLRNNSFPFFLGALFENQARKKKLSSIFPIERVEISLVYLPKFSVLCAKYYSFPGQYRVGKSREEKIIGVASGDLKYGISIRRTLYNNCWQVDRGTETTLTCFSQIVRQHDSNCLETVQFLDDVQWLSLSGVIKWWCR